MGSAIKGCLIKQGTSATFATWESLRYPGAEKLLKAFRFKSKLFSLLVELEADIWVIEGDTFIEGSFVEVSKRTNPDYVPAIMKLHKPAPWSAVPWRQYDVVISVLPIVPDKIIRRHPNILWCYYCLGHGKLLLRARRKGPQGAYDLVLDHHSCGSRVKHLPQRLGFPFPTNPSLTRALVRLRNERAIFLDTRLAQRESKTWFAARSGGLPIRHSAAFPTAKSLVAETFEPTYDYLRRVGSCKYFALARKPGFVGQAALEAAALGLIVVSGPGCYTKVLCHPKALVGPNNLRETMAAIRRIEADPGLQQRILAHQDNVLRDVFWERPLKTLRKSLEMKWAS